MQDLEEKFNDTYYKVIELLIKQSQGLQDVKDLKVPIVPSLYVFCEPKGTDAFEMHVIPINILESTFFVAMKLGAIALAISQKEKPFAVWSVMPVITGHFTTNETIANGLILTGSTLDNSFNSTSICEVKDKTINPLAFNKIGSKGHIQYDLEGDFFRYINILIQLFNQLNIK